MNWNLVAVNTDLESENRMHSDEVARQYGFRAGLVPGVDVFEYMVQAVLEAGDPRWLDAVGYGELRLLKPYYDGDPVQIQLDPENRMVSAVDHASLRYGRESTEVPAPPPFRELPAIRPRASVDSLAPGTVLGTLRKNLRHNESMKARELLELANRILMQNVILEPWIHTGSQIHWCGAAELREVEVRGQIIGQYDRKGHGFIQMRAHFLDVARNGKIAAWVDHTAIWRFRK
jgi:hypothetical protein